MVAHTGFEPVISALRGQCPRPLDECATHRCGSSTVYFTLVVPRVVAVTTLCNRSKKRKRLSHAFVILVKTEPKLHSSLPVIVK